MNELIKKAQAKINIGLNIISKRDDGFHDIETLFYPIKLNDTITFTKSEKTEFTSNAPRLTQTAADNLIMKALRLVEDTVQMELPVSINLNKIVPIGAGLGGGSSDAAVTLLSINELFSLHLASEVMAKMALALGSDVPFFINPVPSIGEGRGEILTPVNISLSEYYLLLVNPGIHVPTGWAYSKVKPYRPTVSLVSLKNSEQIQLPSLTGWLSNDFETPVFENYPEIKELKKLLIASKALYIQMSGSGSSVYAIFESAEDVNNCIPNINPLYFIYHEKL